MVALPRLRRGGCARRRAVVTILERSMQSMVLILSRAIKAQWLAAACLSWTAMYAFPVSAEQLRMQPAPSSTGPAGFGREVAEATFDSVWNRVYNTHFDPEFGGVDWIAIRRELRPRVREVSSTVELRAVLNEMLDRLGQSHFTIIPGASAGVFDRSVRTSPPGEAEPGIDVRWIDGSLLVTGVRSGSPAEQEGVLPGWIIEAVDDVSVGTLATWIREAAPSGSQEKDLATWLPLGVRDRLLGVEGSTARLTFRDESDRVLERSILRAAPSGSQITFGNLPPLRVEAEHRIERLADGVEIGVIRMTAWFPAVVPAIAHAVDEMRDMAAIVLDLRGNPGGIGALVMGIGGHFLSEPVSLGTMHTRDTTLQFVVNPQRVGPDGRLVVPYDGPLVVLVDPLTASTSEIFAGGMQALGRATIIGEPTAGQALPALVAGLPNGDRLMHAIADFTGPGGSRLEGSGVLPDVPVTLDRASLLREADPSLEEALRWISQTLESRE